ncbi:AAA family ATPase [Pelagibacterales bacterium SAG-MED24]|nr:AAA family ATPase [Pelagibacterales bacterium SAG-MED24]
MLTKLSLKNIKSFKNEANLKIAPITLIYGANSSGKSSLWKFLTTLKNSLYRGSGLNFINFDRSYDFANSKTISFDPNRSSHFDFQFDDLTLSDSFLEFYNIKKNELEKDVPIFLRSQNDITEEFGENTGLKFSFGFLNINEHEDTKEIIIDKQYKDILEKLEAKDSLTSAEQELIKTIEEIQKTNTQLIKAKKEVKQLKKDIAKQTKEQNIVLSRLEIYKDKKIFAEYYVIPLSNVPSRMRMFGREGRANITKLNKEAEQEISKIIQKFFKNDFKFQVEYETDGTIQEANFSQSKKDKYLFDFVGPDGPMEIKVSDENPIKYLFIPKSISSEKFFWEEHFNFLQIIKKLIKKNPTNKDKKEPEIYKKYFEEDLNNIDGYYASTKGIDYKKIPEIIQTHDKILEVMTAPLEKFCQIMSEDFRTCILKGSSFIPRSKFYGGTIYTSIFNTLINGFVDIAMESNIEEIGKSFNITEDEALEFLASYARFSKYSYSVQISNLFKFSNDLRNFKAHSNLDRSSGMGAGLRFSPRFISSTLHNTPEHKKRIIQLLDKINLPFDIETQSNRDGDIRVGFTNKKIYNSQKDIPIEQSGNALQSIILLLNELVLSENNTIIIEEPENKIHPNIQGNLIELIAEIIKENSNNIIIETHSEHFILRIQKLIREKKIDANFVSINYVYLDDNGEGSKIDHMQLDEDGKFLKKWRHGFFNERLKEI